MPYEGEPIAMIQTHRGPAELRRLTADERTRAGKDYYCLVGFTHWNPASFFVTLAEDHKATAEALRAAAEMLTTEPTAADD